MNRLRAAAGRREAPRAWARAAAGQAAALALGFAMARTVVFEDFVPFGTAAAAAAPREYAVATAIGAMAGSLLAGGLTGGFRLIAAIFAAAAIRALTTGLLRASQGAPFAAATAAACLIATGLVTLAVRGASVTGLVLVLAEGALAGGAAYFFRRTAAHTGGFRPATMSGQELTCLLVTAAVAALSLVPLRVGPLSPARVAVVFAVLAAARYGRETGGAIAGIAAGLVIALSSSSLSFAAASFAFGGLMAGVFAPLGPVGCTMAFTLSNALFALGAAGSAQTLPVLYEILAGCALFLALPRRWNVWLAERLAPAPVHADADGLQRALVTHLRFASGALREVSQTAEEVSRKLQKLSLPGLDAALSHAEETACRRCGMRVYCWETARGDTLAALLEAARTLRREGTLSAAGLPRDFAARCAHPDRLTRALEQHLSAYWAKEAAERRVSEIRAVMSEQFDGMADMLADMAADMADARRYDADGADRLAEALRQEGILPAALACSVDRFGRLTVELRLAGEQSERVNRARLLRVLSRACGRELDGPCVTETADGKLLTVSERAALWVDFGAAQLACGDNRLCGDAYDYFTDGKGRGVLILSDGMGQGGRAAVDGAMASGLMARLIKAGFGPDCALNIVNSAMLFKSGDESLATVDVCCIDLFDGRVDFYKAGAPATLIRRNGKVSCAEGASLPAGILREVAFDHSSATLSRGDILLMVSDGVTATGVDWIGVELEVWKDGTAAQLADHIADYARRRRHDDREDDITVLAAILQKGA